MEMERYFVILSWTGSVVEWGADTEYIAGACYEMGYEPQDVRAWEGRGNPDTTEGYIYPLDYDTLDAVIWHYEAEAFHHDDAALCVRFPDGEYDVP
jgi:hypothetical protein